MRGGLLGRLLKAQRAAVAPTVGISLFALIGVGGIAFDYARLAAMDSELQSAADMAALAAASQLDGTTNACSRAVTAARTLIANDTRFSNDGDGLAITIANEPGCDATGNVRFYETKDKSTPATDEATANFVEITVDAREAFYALTPVVSAFSSGDIAATAYAGIGSAICKVPPVMICNPSEPLNNTNPDYDFDANALAGVGLKLITGNASAPGNFGFLETGFGSGAANLARALGYNTPPGECLPTDGVDTKPGLNAAVMDALNTRFDLDTNGSTTCPSGGTCSPSRNVRKDLIRGNGCGTTGQGWAESPNPYRPTTAAPLTSGYPDIMGHPRDLCHAISNDLSASIAAGCTLGSGRIGNGSWDRNAYFRVNYGWNDAATWQAQTALSANATRYQVYTWELNNTGTADMIQGAFSGKNGYSYPVCRGTGITPGGTNVDRRRISAAIINCEAEGLNGAETDVPVIKWVDLFLVEPSIQRRRGSTVVTEASDVYVELIGETSSGTAGNTAGQVVRRDVPYLIE